MPTDSLIAEKMSASPDLKAVTMAPMDGKSAATPKGKRWQAAAVGLVALLIGAAIGLAIALPIAHNKWKSDSPSLKSSASISESSTTQAAAGKVREYYVAAERIEWNYTPLGKNNCTGKAFTHEVPSVNNTYTKAVFREYTDNTFKVLKTRSVDEEHLGYLGPILRAEAGDTIKVVFRNNLAFRVSMEPSGVLYSPPSVANPGDTVTYIWRTTAASVTGGASSQMWLYRSTVDPAMHVNAGLVGPIVVTSAGQADAEARPTNVDRELFSFLHIVEEFAVPANLIQEGVTFADATEYVGRRLQQKANATETEEAAAKKLPELHAINGFMYCNQPSVHMQLGDRVRWYVAGLGNEGDLHVAHWHGITLQDNGHRIDSVKLLPGLTYTLNSQADNPGTWLFHCHVNTHMSSGMTSLFHITGKPTNPATTEVAGKTRKYYIAAERREWDYAPAGGDLCHGGKKPQKFSDLTFVGSGPDRIGRKYLKAFFVKYTDDTFKTPKPRPASETHLGMIGPLIRAEVGDKIEVVFKNNVPDRSFSIHPHGVLYGKNGEGAPYNDGAGSNNTGDDAVAPGEQYMYTWLVPERAGPSTQDKSSVMWMYHSHTDEAMDTYAGLMGGIVITQQGSAKEDGSPIDVDRELVLAFIVTDESKSILFPENLRKYLKISGDKAKGGLVKQADAALKSGGYAARQDLLVGLVYPKNVSKVDGTVPAELSEGLAESNLMHNINGYMYCNLPGVSDLGVFQKLRVYAFSLGDLEDMHSPALFGSRFVVDGEGEQAVQVLAGGMLTADMQMSAPGTFMMQCMVNDHLQAGMRALVSVTGSEAALKDSLTGATRRYFISADEVEWDYTPLGYDGCTGDSFGEAEQVFTKTTKGTMGSKYRKARYIQYTDNTWKVKVDTPSTLGILGPLLQAEAGDTVEIVFRNNLTIGPASLKFAGGLVPLSMQKLAAGAKLPDVPTVTVASAYDGRRRLAKAAVNSTDSSTAAVNGTDAVTEELLTGILPGGVAMFTWAVPTTAGPSTDDEAGLVAYTYLSGVDQIAHAQAGLIGVIAVAAAGGFASSTASTTTAGASADVTATSANASAAATVATPAAPYDGRRRLTGSVTAAKFITPLMFTYMNENDSPYLAHNVKAQGEAAKVKIDLNAETLGESNLMHSVNGRLYCNLPAIKLREGEKGIVILLGMGSEEMHTPVFEGMEVQVGQKAVVATSLLPSVTRVAQVTGGKPGNWRAYCVVADHYYAGMKIRMVVNEQEVDSSSTSSSSTNSSTAAAAAPYDGRRLKAMH